MDPVVAPYLKKVIGLKAGGVVLELETAHGLFSSFTVDSGTKFLLRTLAGIRAPATILDVGCGYGPLGLGLKTMYPGAELEMVDRDALAVEVAGGNAERNALEGIRCYGSLGYDQIATGNRFDLVVSNLPGKAGAPVIAELLLGAGAVLEPEGMAAVVVVSALGEQVADTLQQADASIILREDSRSYSVFHYRPPRLGPPRRAVAEGVYGRHRQEFRRAGLNWQASTVWGLAEFDSLAYDTMLMVDLLVNAHIHGGGALIVEPGQGHLALALAAAAEPSSLALVGRDLLALTTTRSNLTANGLYEDRIVTHHALTPDPDGGPFGLALVSLVGKLPLACSTSSVSAIGSRLTVGGTLIIGGRSTDVTRLLETMDGFEVRERSRSHGFSAVRLRKRARSSGGIPA